VGVYKFDPAFVRAITRNRRHRTHDDLEFFETALSIHAHPLHIMCAEPQRVSVVNDAVDLAAANFAFRSSSDQPLWLNAPYGHGKPVEKPTEAVSCEDGAFGRFLVRGGRFQVKLHTKINVVGRAAVETPH